MFHSFLSYDRKQDDATTIAHSKHIIELLKQRNILYSELSTLWENTDGCAENYRCDAALYLMSMLSQAFSVIIDRGISAPRHIREVVDELQLIPTVQLPGAKGYHTQVIMHTGTHTSYVHLDI